MTIRRTLCFLLAVLAFAASPALAGDFGKKTLVGSWEFDVMEMMKSQMAAMGQEMPPGMDEMMKDAYMHIHFDEDGTFRFEMSSSMGMNEDSGTWKVTDEKDGTLTVLAESNSESQSQGQSQEFRISFSSEDAFEAVSAQPGMPESTMKATRMKAEKSE